MDESLELTPIPTGHKKDPAWKHCQAYKDGDREHLKCLYCGKVFKGGGVYRLKEHLAGRKGGGPICSLVPRDVRLSMNLYLEGRSGGKVGNQEIEEDEIRSSKGQNSNSEDMRGLVSPMEIFGNDDGGNARPDGGDAYGSLEINLNSLLDQGDRGTGNDVERGKSTALGLEDKDNPIHMRVGRFLYDIGARFDALDSAFAASFNGIMSPPRGGSSVGISTPSSRDLRGWILKNLVKEVNDEIDRHKSTWIKTGCSIMVEERTSDYGRVLLNFLVQSSHGIVFLKSVDSSSLGRSPDSLYGVLKEVVELVGPENVLQVITNVGEGYSVAGKTLMDSFPSIYWAPCAARCIDLMLEDFGKLEWISGVIEQARSVTRFIYNQSSVLKLMRNFTFGNDILLTSSTRSATDFTTLKRMADFKLNLQSMATSPEWIECPGGALAAADVINNRSFWSSCILIIRLTSPLLHALHVVSSSGSSRKKGSMGYVFAAIYRAKEAIKRELMTTEDYSVYWNIIDNRWQPQKHLYIQAAGFFLNPKFFYSNVGDSLNEIRSKMFDCIERLVPDTDVQDKIARELELYQSAAGDLGRKMAIRTRETLLPAEWWSVYGGGCPNLARLAIRVLSQPCGIPVCKWNHVNFDKIHSTRNSLERQRMNDTAFVQCNLRLKQMCDETRRAVSADAITSENMNMIEDWVAENMMSLDSYGEIDWMSLVPNNANPINPTPLAAAVSSVDETFDDLEILNGLIQMYREEEGATAAMD
ncbi:hypothetical protein LINPERHAP1_LOCUS3583 [Linum perenne]